MESALDRFGFWVSSNAATFLIPLQIGLVVSCVSLGFEPFF